MRKKFLNWGMKLKRKSLLILVIGIIILLVPVPFRLKDGGTVEYKSLVYKIAKVHKLDLNSKTGYTEGMIVEIFGIEVFNNVVENGDAIVDVVEDIPKIDDISMEIKEGTLTNKGATIIITDTSGLDNIYGEEYKIDKKVKGKWQELKPIIDNYGFDMIGYSVSSNNQLEMNVDWEWLYGKLEHGEYRLVKKVNNQEIAVLFTI